MAQPLESLPELLLDAIVSHALQLSPSLTTFFLASCGSLVHSSAIRVLFNTISIADDAREFQPASPLSRRGPLLAILANAERYGGVVKNIDVVDYDVPYSDQAASETTAPHDDGKGHRGFPRPIDADQLYALLTVCPNIDQFAWKSSNLPPDGICEAIASNNARLSSFIFAPSSYPQAFHGPPLPARKWDALSLPLLSTLPISVLQLSRLSQVGSRALSCLLTRLGEYSFLEEVVLDFVWLDDPLVIKLVNSGKRIRSLQISTSGTKLSDKGIKAVLEGCDALEHFSLVDVEGRLARTTWSNVSHFPSALKSLKVDFAEARPHHSWTADHLLSLYAAPLESLTHLFITRNVKPSRLKSSSIVFEHQLDDMAALRRVPEELVMKLKGPTSLINFECDWWAWALDDIKVVLESCSKLQTLRFCLDAPFSKLLSLTSTFASLSHLRRLYVCITPPHAPGTPPLPKPPVPDVHPMPPTPGGSPVSKAKSVLPQLLDFDQMRNQTCVIADDKGDPSMPPLRDVKRFVRKCPRLEVLEWYGKAARGSWCVIRPQAPTSKVCINVSVDYLPPTVSGEIWASMMRDQDIMNAVSSGRFTPGELDRRGQVWVGENADELAAEQAVEREKEAANNLRDREKPGKLKDLGRRACADGHQLPTPIGSADSSFAMHALSQLTPPESTNSVSSMLPESPPSSGLTLHDDEAADASMSPRRIPSEPSLRKQGSRGGNRARSATTAASDTSSTSRPNDTSRGPSSSGKNSRKNGDAGSGNRGQKSARGGGGRRGRGAQHSTSSSTQRQPRTRHEL